MILLQVIIPIPLIINTIKYSLVIKETRIKLSTLMYNYVNKCNRKLTITFETKTTAVSIDTAVVELLIEFYLIRLEPVICSGCSRPII